MIPDIKHLHEIGFSIIWLKPRSKQPVEMSWTKKDRHSFAALREMHVDGMNVGVRLGSNSPLENGTFLAVIDCDVKSEDAAHLNEMEKALDLLGFDWTMAPTVLSGRGNGSRHIYVATKEPVAPFTFVKSAHVVRVHMPSVERLSAKEKEFLTEEEIAQGLRLRPAWEISVMGSGQQVVLPPSVHPDSGRPYEWANEIRTVNDLEVVELKRPEKKDNGTFDRAGIKSPKNIVFPLVDLLSSKLSTKYFDLIVRGIGLEAYDGDRSRAVMASVFAMVNVGFSDDEIMSVLTDVENELASVAFEHAKTRDREKAARWIFKYNIAKARKELAAEKAFDGVAIVEDVLSEEDAKAQDLEVLGDWEARLDRNAHMNPRPTFKNTVLILEHVTGKALFKYDRLFQTDRYADVPPWTIEGHRGSWIDKEIADVDLSAAQNYLGQHFRIEPSIDFISRAVGLIARKNAYHPVQQYLEGLYWDGVPRIDTWLTKYMGVVENEFTRQAGAKFLCAMIGRAMAPGCKWDHVLILEGAQGIYKSTACAVLGGQWFSSRLGDYNTKDVVENMRGNWIIEISELANMRKHDVGVLKDFISTQVDEVRKAYARRSEKFPRQCVFIGTTNESEYLQDETGNRRFWPVKVERIDIEALRADRDQLFAEAFERWVEGETLYLSKEAEAIAKEAQGERMEHDSWADRLRDVLETDEFLSKSFRLDSLWEKFAGPTDIGGMKLTPQIQKRIGRALRMLGYASWAHRTGSHVERRWAKRE